jgi:hypothetical protein
MLIRTTAFLLAPSLLLVNAITASDEVKKTAYAGPLAKNCTEESDCPWFISKAIGT